jgi:hypothetical protein
MGQYLTSDPPIYSHTVRDIYLAKGNNKKVFSGSVTYATTGARTQYLLVYLSAVFVTSNNDVVNHVKALAQTCYGLILYTDTDICLE